MRTPTEVLAGLEAGPRVVRGLMAELRDPDQRHRPAGRNRFRARLATVSPADSADHTAHGRYSLFLMCRHVVLHDMLHAYRIEEVLLRR
jgi:hypothetical protein